MKKHSYRSGRPEEITLGNKDWQKVPNVQNTQDVAHKDDQKLHTTASKLYPQVSYWCLTGVPAMQH